MFKKRKIKEEYNPVKIRRDELQSEVRRWFNEIDRQLDVVLAQSQMTFLFPSGCPDDRHTKEVLEREQKHLQALVGEYDWAVANLQGFAKDHPEIICATCQDSHTAIRTMLRWKNKR